MASGGVKNKRSITFWSESRFSVNTNRRKDRNRTSSAASAAAQHTFRIRMKRRSRPPLRISISLVRCDRVSAITLAKAGGDVKRCGGKDSIRRLQRCLSPLPVIILVRDEAKNTIQQAVGKGAHCRPSRSANSIRPISRFWNRRLEERRRSDRDSARVFAICSAIYSAIHSVAKWKGAARARALAMSHRRCVYIRALRLPRPTRVFTAENCSRAIRRAALYAAGRARNRIDQ